MRFLKTTGPLPGRRQNRTALRWAEDFGAATATAVQTYNFPYILQHFCPYLISSHLVTSQPARL